MNRRNTFRYVVGMVAVIGGFIGLIALYFVEIPLGNRDAVTLALGLVLGWGGSVINGEWGSSPAGRDMADFGARMASETPIKTELTNTKDNPVPTIEGES